MVLECRFGLIMLNMKESGKIIWHMERESSGMLMGTYTVVNGRRIRPTVMAFTNI